MPIVNLPQNPPESPKPNIPTVAVVNPAYRHSVVDTTLTPHSSLITYIEGSNFYGDWYSQIVSGDEELSEFQPNQIAPYQQYHKIIKLQTKLQDSLSFSNDEETNILSVTGSLILFPHLIPNRGDVFIADVGDGRAGQFTVTNVSPLSYFKEACYSVTINLARWVDESLITKLDERVVKTSYFVSDYLIYGKNPIIAEERLIAQSTITEFRKELFALYNSQFFSNEFHSYLVPGQVGSVYDPYVNKGLKAIHDTREHNNLLRIRLQNVDGLDNAFQYSLYDAIIYKDRTRLAEAFRDYWLVSTSFFNSHINYQSIYYSGIKYCICAKQNVMNVDHEYTETYPLAGIALRELNDFQIDIASAYYRNSIDEFLYPGDTALDPESVFVSDEVPLIHAIVTSPFYVFSEAFYNQDATGYSKLEHLVSTYLDTGDINRTVLYGFCQSVRAWGRLEKFYYVPILLMLLKASERLS